jgi:hypothetical protein
MKKGLISVAALLMKRLSGCQLQMVVQVLLGQVPLL